MRRLLPRKPRAVIYAILVLVAIANWIVGPRLYPHYRAAITGALITLVVADLLIFGTLDSIRRRRRNRKRNHAVP